MSDVTALSLEHGIRLVSDDEHNVSRDFIPALITFFLERNFGPCFPSWFHMDSQHFILFFGSAVGLDDAAGNLHLLHAALGDVFKRYIQVMLDRRVLGFFFSVG